MVVTVTVAAAAVAARMTMRMGKRGFFELAVREFVDRAGSGVFGMSRGLRGSLRVGWLVV